MIELDLKATGTEQKKREGKGQNEIRFELKARRRYQKERDSQRRDLNRNENKTI